MSEENVEMVRQSLSSWSKGDDEAALRDADPSIVWQLAGVFPGFKPEYRGHAGVKTFWEAFREPWEAITLEPLEVTEVDDRRVLAVIRFRGMGRASGAETTVEYPVLWTFEGGKAVHLRTFATRQEAIEAAGLSE